MNQSRSRSSGSRASALAAKTHASPAILPLPHVTAPRVDSPRDDAVQAVALLKALVGDLFYVEDKTSDLPVRQLKVCAFLHENPRTMSEVAHELGVTQSAMTQIIDRLERSGLVARSASVEDRRVKTISLTTRGARAMRQRDDARIARINQVLEHMAAAQRSQALDALRAIADACAATSMTR